MDLMTKARTQWDRLLGAATLMSGVVGLIIGWLGVSGTPYPAEQLPYIISAGVGGLFLLGVSAVLWLSADLHDEWRKLDRIEQAIRATEFNDAHQLDRTVDIALEQDVEPEQTRRLRRVADGAR